MNRIVFFILLAVLILAPSLTPAATGRILEEVEALQADATALTAEAELFKSIGFGIALSLAQCEEQSACNPAVSKDELGHLLKTLDKRINDLVTRQEQKEGDYAEVLTAYVNQRESYLRYQADLVKITGGTDTGTEDMTGDAFGEAAAPAESVSTPAETSTVETAPALEDVFSDVEEELE